LNNYIELIVNDIRKLWGGLQLPQKLMFCALVIAMVGALTFFIAKSTEPNWSVLYSDLQDQDVVSITESLKKNGYQYKLSDDKKTIFVPLDKKEELRLYVAENDMITDSSPGFELLDKVQLGATDFQNKLTKQRIFQGELTRTIERINGVQKVRVQLAEPERSVFANNDEEPSASVMLVLAPGVKLRTEQVKSIKNLVAYSIPRLKPERVFVSDQNGEVLSEEISKNSTDIEQYKASFEKNTAKKVRKVLERIVGADNVSVEVSVDMNFDSARATIEKYIPVDGSTTGILTSAQSEVEVYDKGSNKPKTDAEKAEANINEKTIAAVIPDAVKLNIPVINPIIPTSFADTIAPCTNKCPKLVIGTNAPPPAHKINLSYILNISKNEPKTTNIVVMCPGVKLVLSKINCPRKHTTPQNINAFI